ncbi:FAD-dependent monooxygenase [Nonomuraea jabiensis]|uniref:FAD-dependent monooxygenase n=1 Tax=Nonomuraea jabiensis TaxID=882448 RepID=UPI00341766F2
MHGGNVLEDAQNLAWKLALTLKGTAGPGLLDSYDAERRPLASLVLTDALTRISVIPPSEELPAGSPWNSVRCTGPRRWSRKASRPSCTPWSPQDCPAPACPIWGPICSAGTSSAWPGPAGRAPASRSPHWSRRGPRPSA